MGIIKPIESGSVHRIHAGQVVLELQQAVKELVENSLDAGATTVEVRIKDHGKDTVEVLDNGSGISEEDWPSIGLKHHTSKLPSLVDLPNVTTFGFRGEALSALCALCESVTIVTATKETAPLGAVIKLGKDGKIQDCSCRIARPRGTTITISGLFSPLPVRRKEFERNAKREFTKALSTLTSYALVPASVSKEDGREGVKLKVESIAAGKNGKRNAMIVTDGRGYLRSSIISIWGPKALDNILDVNLELEVGIDRSMAKREGVNVASQMVKVTGLISTAAWGQGRSSPDRQFYYINGRPVDLPVVAKAVNEVYKSFNTHQLPLVVLDFSVPRDSVDINVSPDKRSIFLHSEAQLVDALRASLEEFFQPTRSSFAIEGASQKTTLVQSSLMPTSRSVTQMPSNPEIGETEDSTSDGEENQEAEAHVIEESQASEATVTDVDEPDLDDRDAPVEPTSLPTRRNTASISTATPISSRPSRSVPTFRQNTSSSSSATRPRPVQTIQTSTASWSPDHQSSQASKASSNRSQRADLGKRIEVYTSQKGQARATSSEDDDEPEEEDLEMDENEEESEKGEVVREDAEQDIVMVEVAAGSPGPVDVDAEASPPPPVAPPNMVDMASSPPPSLPPIAGPSRRRRSSSIPVIIALDQLSEREQDHSRSYATLTPSKIPAYREEISSTAVTSEMTLSFDLDKLRERHRKRRRLHHPPTPSAKTKTRAKDAFSVLSEGGLSSAAGIGNRDITSAGEALSRVISKSDFQSMEVLGQFNKGFIVARLRHPKVNGRGGTDDLFIVDQHASDEKFNFETLQRTTQIRAQTLIRPRPLELTAGDEIVAIENLDILNSNGFKVKIDEDKAPGRGERISLTAMPVSKETTFDFKDLEQLLHLLSDGARPAGQMVRCTKARSMFAMRACRKSVMIGKSLTKAQMVTLLRNMGTIDQPWNCPHGRPTMRHLTKLDTVQTRSGVGASRIDWSNWSPPA